MLKGIMESVLLWYHFSCPGLARGQLKRQMWTAPPGWSASRPSNSLSSIHQSHGPSLWNADTAAPLATPVHRRSRRVSCSPLPTQKAQTQAHTSATTLAAPTLAALATAKPRTRQARGTSQPSTRRATFTTSPGPQTRLQQHLQLSDTTLQLPGMLSGPPATDKQLLDAVGKLSQEDFARVARDVQLMQDGVSNAGPRRAFVFDTETTNNYAPFRAIELAVKDWNTGDVFDTLVNPGMAVTPGAAATHGIGSRHLAGQPSTQVSSLALMLWVHQRCKAAGGNTVVLVAHNAAFDLQVLSHNLMDASLVLPPGWLACCTYAMARQLKKLPAFEHKMPGDNKLGTLHAAFCGAAHTNAHRAKSDVLALEAVLRQWLGMLSPRSTMTDALHHDMFISGTGKLVKQDSVDTYRARILATAIHHQDGTWAHAGLHDLAAQLKVTPDSTETWTPVSLASHAAQTVVRHGGGSVVLPELLPAVRRRGRHLVHPLVSSAVVGAVQAAVPDPVAVARLQLIQPAQPSQECEPSPSPSPLATEAVAATAPAAVTKRGRKSKTAPIPAPLATQVSGLAATGAGSKAETIRASKAAAAATSKAAAAATSKAAAAATSKAAAAAGSKAVTIRASKKAAVTASLSEGVSDQQAGVVTGEQQGSALQSEAGAVVAGQQGSDVGQQVTVVAAAKSSSKTSRGGKGGSEDTGSTMWPALMQTLDRKPLDTFFTDTMANRLTSARLGTLIDLLMHFPRDYHVFSTRLDPEAAKQKVALPVYVSSVGNVMKRTSFQLLKASFEVPLQGGKRSQHSTAHITATFISHGYFDALSARKKDLPMRSYVILLASLEAGKEAGTWTCTNPKIISATDKKQAWVREQLLGFTPAPDQPDTAPARTIPASPVLPSRQEVLLPIYSARTPCSSRDFLNPEGKLDGLLRRGLKALQLLAGPAGEGRLLGGHSQIHTDLLPWWQAILQLHAPGGKEEVQRARTSVAYHELFFLQLRLVQRRKELTQMMNRSQVVVGVEDGSVWTAARDSLPFKLTAEQQRVLNEVLADMQGPHAMFRLLQGDVGSGKTVVAMLSMLATAASGGQAVLVAPTEILAAQHHQVLTTLVKSLPRKTLTALGGVAAVTPTLRIGSLKESEKKSQLAGFQSGAIKLVVGTHSVLHTSGWKRVGLVVIDEQHKFGTTQKQRLLELCPGVRPHVLTMSATPIPRTMASVIYGDMEVSLIQGRPPGRQPVTTRVLADDDAGRAAMYAAVKKEVKSGGRAFIVYPGKGVPLQQVEKEEDEEEEGSVAKKTRRAASTKSSSKVKSTKAASKGKTSSKVTSKTSSKVKAAAKTRSAGRPKKAAAVLNSDEEEQEEEEEEMEEMEESEREALKTATQDFEHFEAQRVFGEHKCVLLHGGMSSADKEAAISAHRSGACPIMVCTSVVEVGVDVPEASIMAVQQADRFGLAQLHQMRGRVGRSSRKSSCLLMLAPQAGQDASLAEARLTTLVNCHDGLDIAETDLRLRGAGSLFSSNTRQSGSVDCTSLCANQLISDPSLLTAAREAAFVAMRDGLDVQTKEALAAFQYKFGTPLGNGQGTGSAA